MWKCSNCHHLEVAPERSKHCPVCGANQEKLLPHQVSGINGTKTLENLKAAFVAESQAHQRGLAFAMQADQDDLPQIARLFRAIAEAEGIHAFSHLRLLEGVSSTQENLEAAFERENLERQVIAQLRSWVLTEETLQKLVILTNEKLEAVSSSFSGRLEVIDAELRDVRGRLKKLYEALETGKLVQIALAP